MANVGHSPAQHTRVPRSSPLEDTFNDYVSTPPSQRRPIEEYLPGLRFETAMATRGPPRSVTPDNVTGSGHGSGDGVRSVGETAISRVKYIGQTNMMVKE